MCIKRWFFIIIKMLVKFQLNANVKAFIKERIIQMKSYQKGEIK